MTDPLDRILIPFSPESFSLSGENVHIWQASLTQPEEIRAALSALLAADEQQRAARFFFEHLRERYSVGRGFLRLLLAAYLGTSPAAVNFTYNTYGKPLLAPSHTTPLNFNLANSQDRVVYIFTPGCRAGIDLEYVRPMPDEDQLAAMFFSERESRLLRALPAPQKTETFFRLWTGKEAYLKAVGAGLAGDLKQVEVETGENPHYISLAGDETAARRWLLRRFTPWPGCLAACAIETPAANISFRNL